MCFDYDSYEAPTAYRETDRTARKCHDCTECGETILPGERYREIWGVWYGHPTRYKQCMRCQRLIHAIQEVEVAEGCHRREGTPPLGDLFAHLGDYADRIQLMFPDLIGCIPSPDADEVWDRLWDEHNWSTQDAWPIDDAELGCPVG
jgi:hypothetical protein